MKMSSDNLFQAHLVLFSIICFINRPIIIVSILTSMVYQCSIKDISSHCPNQTEPSHIAGDFRKTNCHNALSALHISPLVNFMGILVYMVMTFSHTSKTTSTYPPLNYLGMVESRYQFAEIANKTFNSFLLQLLLTALKSTSTETDFSFILNCLLRLYSQVQQEVTMILCYFVYNLHLLYSDNAVIPKNPLCNSTECSILFFCPYDPSRPSYVFLISPSFQQT